MIEAGELDECTVSQLRCEASSRSNVKAFVVDRRHEEHVGSRSASPLVKSQRERDGPRLAA